MTLSGTRASSFLTAVSYLGREPDPTCRCTQEGSASEAGSMEPRPSLLVSTFGPACVSRDQHDVGQLSGDASDLTANVPLTSVVN